MITPFRALVRKDLQLFVTDPRAVVMVILAPIVLASFFGYIFSGQSGKTESSRVPVRVIDQDGSAISREIVARLSADKALGVKQSSLDESRAAVQRGNATVAVVIPKDFGADAGRAFFNAAKKPEIRVLYDPSHGPELGMVQGILTGRVMEVVSKEMFTGKSGSAVVKESLARIDQADQISPDDKKALRDLLQSVEKWNERSESGSASGQGPLSGGLTTPYQLREEAITAGSGVKYNGYAHAFAGMGV